MWLHRRRSVFPRNHLPPFSTAFVCWYNGLHQSHLVWFETQPLTQHLAHRQCCHAQFSAFCSHWLTGTWLKRLTQSSMLSSGTRSPPELLPLHKHPVSTNCRYNLVTLFLYGASFLNRVRNSRCIVITDLASSKRSTQKGFFCYDAILKSGPAAPQ
jgi:hypothetical protein